MVVLFGAADAIREGPKDGETRGSPKGKVVPQTFDTTGARPITRRARPLRAKLIDLGTKKTGRTIISNPIIL